MALNSFFPCLRVPGAKPPVTLVHKAFKSSAGAVLGIPMLLLLAGGGSRTAFAQAVTYTGSGAVSFGSVNACASGKATPAPCSKTLALTYNVTASGGLGTPKALTAGAPNQDYKVASGSTCTGSVTMGNTCKVNVTFAPTLPGARNGAVEIVDDSGNALATTYIYGTGVGPQITFSQPAQRMIVGNFGYDRPLAAVDGNGNVFVTAEGATSSAPGLVEELLAVNGSVPTNPVVKVLAQSQGIYSGPTSVAVDGAGNVFFTASQYPEGGYVEELLAADGYVTSTFLGGNTFFAEPTGIAVDGSGNVFVCSTGDEMSGNYFFGGLYEIPAAGGYATVNTLGGGFVSNPYGIALDASGNLFAANADIYSGVGSVLELTPNDGYSTVRTININNGTEGPYNIAVDAAGNLFTLFTSLEEFFAVDGVLPESPASRTFPQFAGIPSFDNRGNLYLVNPNGLREIQLSAESTLYFEQTIIGQTSSDSPQSIEIQNEGNATLDLSGLSLDSSNWALVKGSGSPKDCTATTSLAISALCNLSVSFEPKEFGRLSGALLLTDNSLNAAGTTQPVPLKGSGDSTPPPHVSSLSNTYAAPYSVVILYGTNFGATQGSSTVTFNGIATPHYYWSDTKIYVTVPPDATSGNVVVAVGGEYSDAVAFTVVPMPVVTGISPTSGPAGSFVTISGQNLADYENQATVTLNGKPVPLFYVNTPSTEILVQVPNGASTGHFHVLVNDTGMNTPTFTVTH